jgi:hypothetical protein
MAYIIRRQIKNWSMMSRKGRSALFRIMLWGEGPERFAGST